MLMSAYVLFKWLETPRALLLFYTLRVGNKERGEASREVGEEHRGWENLRNYLHFFEVDVEQRVKEEARKFN